jgi:phage gp45-like
MATQADNMITRVQSIKCYDDKDQQCFEADGRKYERFGGTSGKYAVPRIQGYGFTSHPPKGSQGITTTLGGNPENTMLIGMEHPEHRPKNLAEGEFKQYEMWGGYDYGKQDKWVRKVGTATIECFRDGKVHINRPGAS